MFQTASIFNIVYRRMRVFLLTAICSAVYFFGAAQSVEDVVSLLKTINRNTSEKTFAGGGAAAISNRAMNVFLADKTGYLSASKDLSYFTNYTTFNSIEGKITVNHNFQPAPGDDDRLKTLFSVGFDMQLASSYTKGFFDNRFENELGISLDYKWLGRVRTVFKESTQRIIMDGLRWALLQEIIAGIEKKSNDFKIVLDSLASIGAPVQNIPTLKTALQQNFYKDLKATVEERFAVMQAALLTKTANFKRISTGWTSVNAYLPLVFPTYHTAASFTTAFSSKHPYAAGVSVSHTRLWESAAAGRFFFTAGGNVLFNNAKLSYRLSKFNFTEYKGLGGTMGQPGSDKIYIGAYETFLTASLCARAVYFPRESHVGISLLAEQYVGKYDWLNLRVAIPVVLINSKKTPAVNIECYVLFLDCSNRQMVSNGPGKTQLGLSVGIPFSRLMF